MPRRTDILRELHTAIDALFDGTSKRSVLFVTGEAGIGKSTLLDALREELLERTQARPVSVALAACSTPVAGHEIGGVEALEPWARVMAGFVSAPTSSRIAGALVGQLARAWVRVIPIVGDVLESALETAKIVRRHYTDREAFLREAQRQSAASQQQMFQQYVNFLGEYAKHAPIVVMLDDAHWADPSSLNLLFTAARQLQGHPVAFIVAYRPDDVASRADGGTQPLSVVRAELERYELAAEVGVPTMSSQDIDELIAERCAGYAANSDFERWIARISGGNPLFITQFLATLEADGYLDPVTGTITNGYESVAVPPTAAAVIDERLRRLPSDMRELLRYASVEGETFTSLVLTRITELNRLKVLQQLRLIEEMHALIRSLGARRIYATETPSWSFAHTLVQRSLYSGLHVDERLMIHEIVLDALKEEWKAALTSGHNVPGIAARIAVHAEVVAQHFYAAEVLLEGARASWGQYAEAEAVTLLDGVDRALERIAMPHAESNVARLRASAMMLRADIAFHHGRTTDAEASYSAARRLAGEAGDPIAVIDAANGLARTQYWRAEYEDALDTARAAIEASYDHAYPRGEAMAELTIGQVRVALGDSSQALDSFNRAQDAAMQIDSTGSEHAMALNSIGKLQREIGNLDAARTAFEECLAVARENGDRVTEANVLNNLGNLLTYVGDDAESERRLEECRAVCRATGNRWTEAYCEANIGVLLDKQGSHQRALACYESALSTVSQFDDAAMEALLFGNIGNALERLGRSDEALAYYRRGLARYEAIGNNAGIAGACVMLADSLRDIGARDEARMYAKRALDIAATAGLHEVAAWSHRALAQIARDDAANLGGVDREALMRAALDHAKIYVEIFRATGSRHLDEAVTLHDELRAIAESKDEATHDTN